MSPEAPGLRQPGDTTGGTGDALVAPQLEHMPASASAAGKSSLCHPRETHRTKEQRLLLPWSGRVGAGRAAESAAVTSTAQRMRHLQVNIPLLQLLPGDWDPQLPLHGGPGMGGHRGVSTGLSAPTSCEGAKQSQGRASSPHPTIHHRRCSSHIQPRQQHVPGSRDVPRLEWQVSTDPSRTDRTWQ